MNSFTPVISTHIGADFSPPTPLLVADLDASGAIIDSHVAILRVGPYHSQRTLPGPMHERHVVLHGIPRRLYEHEGCVWDKVSPYVHAFLPILKCTYAEPTDAHAIPFRDLQPGMILCGQPRIVGYSCSDESIMCHCCAQDSRVVGWNGGYPIIAMGSGSKGTVATPEDGIAHILVYRTNDFVLK